MFQPYSLTSVLPSWTLGTKSRSGKMDGARDQISPNMIFCRYLGVIPVFQGYPNVHHNLRVFVSTLCLAFPSTTLLCLCESPAICSPPTIVKISWFILLSLLACCDLYVASGLRQLLETISPSQSPYPSRSDVLAYGLTPGVHLT